MVMRFCVWAHNPQKSLHDEKWEKAKRELAVCIIHEQPYAHAYKGPIAVWQGTESWKRMSSVPCLISSLALTWGQLKGCMSRLTRRKQGVALPAPSTHSSLSLSQGARHYDPLEPGARIRALAVYLKGSRNVGREVGTWNKKMRVAGTRCTLKPATIVGDWSLILQGNSQKLYNACASDLSYLEVKGAGIFLAQFYQSLAIGTPVRC